MPAPRHYSHAQEDAILALGARGLSSRQVSEQLAEGYESLAPFKIPDRTVRAILQRNARDRQPSDPRIDSHEERKAAVRDQLVRRLEAAYEREHGPGPLTEHDAQPCQAAERGGFCDELAVEARLVTDRHAQVPGQLHFLCQHHLELAENDGRLEPLVQPARTGIVSVA